jgi:hypothetical protein
MSFARNDRVRQITERAAAIGRPRCGAKGGSFGEWHAPRESVCGFSSGTSGYRVIAVSTLLRIHVLAWRTVISAMGPERSCAMTECFSTSTASNAQTSPSSSPRAARWRARASKCPKFTGARHAGRQRAIHGAPTERESKERTRRRDSHDPPFSAENWWIGSGPLGTAHSDCHTRSVTCTLREPVPPRPPSDFR